METTKNPLTLFILGFVTIVVGLSLLPQIATQTTAAANLPGEANKTITFVNRTIIPLGVSYIVSGSEKVWGGYGSMHQVLNPGAGTDPNYTIDYTNGKIVLYNSSAFDWYNKTTLNVTYIDGSKYVYNPTARTVVGMLQVFYALGVTIAGVYIAIQGFKGIGLM